MSIILHIITDEYQLIAADGRVMVPRKIHPYQPLQLNYFHPQPTDAIESGSEIFKKIISYQNGFVSCFGTYGPSGNDVFDMIKSKFHPNTFIANPLEFTQAIYNNLVYPQFENVGVSIGFQNKNKEGIINRAYVIHSQNWGKEVTCRNCFLINGAITVEFVLLKEVFRNAFLKTYDEHMINDIFDKPFNQNAINKLLHHFFLDAIDIYPGPITSNTKISYAYLRNETFNWVNQTPSIISLV